MHYNDPLNETQLKIFPIEDAWDNRYRADVCWRPTKSMGVLGVLDDIVFSFEVLNNSSVRARRIMGEGFILPAGHGAVRK